MNVHATALAETHHLDEPTFAFARDVIDDLSRAPKRLSPKYFYDATGSELFEQITVLPEYYPTRTELSILRDHGDAIDGLYSSEEFVGLGDGTLLGLEHTDRRRSGRGLRAGGSQITERHRHHCRGAGRPADCHSHKRHVLGAIRQF